MPVENRLLKPTDQIYDLIDVVETASPVVELEQEVIIIDGRGYDRVLKPEDKVYDLSDVVEEGKNTYFHERIMDEEVRKIVLETAEKIARELIPDIAERVIKEEIEKLKHCPDGDV